ncbi:UDP-glycosyltransferase UGT5-like isoform X1 [Rhynchophorus ferrugineus]|uniref:UDP-glycosyltransferase UGT5-like isoform X1 n=1 Tax=Rhynchophorus ferrugineus TaxID=354439 RepID=UPI003FCD45AE
MLILLQCFGLLLPLTYGAKILGVFMTPSHSHQVIFQSIWKELSLRGHQVTVYTPFPLRDESLTNLTEYDLSFTYDLLKEISDFGKDISADGNIYHMLKMLKVITDAQLEHQSMQDLIKNPNNETYDLFLVEYIWQSYFAFKDIYKVPMVGVLSLPPTVNMADSLGLDKHPIVDPELMLHFSQAKTFKERLQSWMTKWIFRIFHRTKFQPLYNEQLVKYFNVDTPSYELAKDASLLIGSFNFGIYNAKPRFANYIPVNSLHIHPPKPLPDDLASFLNKTKNDVIYFSLGTNVKMSKIAPEARKKIFNVLGSLPYTILWKYDKDIVPEDTPKNFYTRLWYPQQDVLAHPKVKLFITQGGLQSIDEALDRKVPMLIIPIFGDQPNNADRCVSKKIAEKIDIQTFTKEELRSKILQLIDGPIYREHIEKQFAIANDQPMSGLDTAIFWIEYVIRHKGAPHLRSPLLDLPFYQYYLLDIYSFLGVAIAVILAVIYFTMKFTLLTVCKLLNKSSAKQKLS